MDKVCFSSLFRLTPDLLKLNYIFNLTHEDNNET